MEADHQKPREAAVVIHQQQRDYLDEHLPYMLKMLRYTYGQMLHEQHYLSWNAHFESFAVHARNLVALLTNSDDGNFKASHFVEGYRRRKGDLQGPMRKLDEQVFHLAKRRPGTVIGKFDTGNAKEVFDWIEENFADFLTKLGALRPLFNDKRLIRPRTRASTSPLVQPDLERRLKWRVPPLSFPSRVTRRVWR